MSNMVAANLYLSLTSFTEKFNLNYFQKLSQSSSLNNRKNYYPYLH